MKKNILKTINETIRKNGTWYSAYFEETEKYCSYLLISGNITIHCNYGMLFIMDNNFINLYKVIILDGLCDIDIITQVIFSIFEIKDKLS